MTLHSHVLEISLHVLQIPDLLSKRLYSHANDRVWREHQRGPQTIPPRDDVGAIDYKDRSITFEDTL